MSMWICNKYVLCVCVCVCVIVLIRGGFHGNIFWLSEIIFEEARQAAAEQQTLHFLAFNCTPLRPFSVQNSSTSHNSHLTFHIYIYIYIHVGLLQG